MDVMAVCTLIPTFLLILVQTLSSVHGGPSLDPQPRTVVGPLRETYGRGAFGRFLVSRQSMEEIVRSRTNDDSLVLVSTQMKRDYDTERYTEVLIFLGNYSDTTLRDATPPSGEWTSEGSTLIVLLPVVAHNGYRVDLVLNYFTDTTVPLLVPFVTNYGAVGYIDSIRDYSDGVVALRDGVNSVMVVGIEHGDGCEDDYATGHDFDEALGRHLHLTSYNQGFDWGCDDFANLDFCQSEDYVRYRQELLDAGGNVCTTMTTGYSNRCPASMRILEMTGRFRAEMPYLAGIGGPWSIEAEWVTREHTVGLVFPCV